MHNIVIFGASITQGAFDGEGGGWANRLATYCFAKNHETLVFNLGISGDTSRGIKDRFESELGRRVEDAEKVTVLISVGGNDSLVEVATGHHMVEVDEYETNMTHCVQYAKGKGYDVVLIGLARVDEARTNPLPWHTEFAERNSEIIAYDTALQQVASTSGALYVPMLDLFEHTPELLSDGDHPTAYGHRLMFERVREYLEKAKII